MITRVPDGRFIEWSGAPPGPDLTRSLRVAGIGVARAPADGAALRVLHTRKPHAPRPPLGPRPWVWLPQTRPSAETLAEAAARGALDAFALGDPADVTLRLAR